MNEFENLLSAAQPAQGRSDPMQIMFLAGQESVDTQPKSGAGGWQIATGLLTVACVVLTTCLMVNQSETGPGDFAKALEPRMEQQIKRDAVTPERSSPQQFAFSHPETSLENPDSWELLGPRTRQLESITQSQLSTGQSPSEANLSPFTFHRDLNQDVF